MLPRDPTSRVFILTTRWNHQLVVPIASAFFFLTRGTHVTRYRYCNLSRRLLDPESEDRVLDRSLS
jgi:hypothetical protein